MKQYILALDQGTTSCRAILFDHEGNIEVMAQKEIRQIYKEDGWVEQDPMEIYTTQLEVMEKVLHMAKIQPNQIKGIGITNQRETTVVWDRATGLPVYNAIVWQSRQTASICEVLKEEGLEPYVREHTGLLIDAYFSGTKIKWILEHIDYGKERANKGELLFGTIDTWLIYKLTSGQIHVTDYSNASRTMLFNINTLDWDQYLLEKLGIPSVMLPVVKSSSEVYGYIDVGNLKGHNIPIAGIAGDQQAALFGQTCYSEGAIKATYGTGCFILMNTGKNRIQSKNGLLTTIAWGLDGEITYALEGSIFMGGAVIQWLRDELRLIHSSKESEYFASLVEDTGGVYLVPAFSGLGAPYWDMYARGTILGLTRGTNRNHIIRAGLEAIAYQNYDVIQAMLEDAQIALTQIKVDGGASANDFLMQFQADLLDRTVQRPEIIETTCQGAAYLAGLAVGFWNSKDEIIELQKKGRRFVPDMQEKSRIEKINGWKQAVSKTMT